MAPCPVEDRRVQARSVRRSEVLDAGGESHLAAPIQRVGTAVAGTAVLARLQSGSWDVLEPLESFLGGHDLALAGLLIRTVPGAPNPH